MAAQSGSVGSTSWISSERQTALGFIDLEIEEFSISANHEAEWLNEHMAQIFSKGQLDVTEVFKTPGKLRGKTPRTARKAFGDRRPPLTDVFSADSPSRAFQPLRIFPVPTADARDTSRPLQDVHKIASKSYRAGKENADSGYVGTTDDDMSMIVEEPPRTFALAEVQVSDSQPTREATAFQNELAGTQARTKFTLSTEANPAPVSGEANDGDVVRSTPKMKRVVSHAEKSTFIIATSPPLPPPRGAAGVDHSEYPIALDEEDEGPHPQTLIRKSSLNFALLPAREPLNTKKSLGARASTTSLMAGRKTNGKSLGGTLEALRDDGEEDDGNTTTAEFLHADEEAQPETVLHNKLSSQSLANKINSMLKQPQPARPTKPVLPASVVASQVEVIESRIHIGSDLSKSMQQASFATQMSGTTLHDDDDWIPKPAIPTMNPGRPTVNRATTDLTASMVNTNDSVSSKPDSETSVKYPMIANMPPLVKTISVSNPTHAIYTTSEATSTTPAGSPVVRKTTETPLSAKEKLASIMKSARGIFTSSGTASERGRLALLSSPRNGRNEIIPPSHNSVLTGEGRARQAMPLVPEPRKTRSSTEREKEQRYRERMDNDLEKVRDKVRQQALDLQNRDCPVPNADRSIETFVPESESVAPFIDEDGQEMELDAESEDAEALLTTANPRPSLAQQPRRLKEMKRPIRPTKDVASKAKPAPVSIRVGTASTISQLDPDSRKNASQMGAMAPPAPSISEPTAQLNQQEKGQALKAKTSAQSLHRTASNSSMYRAASSTSNRPKALVLAAREKEKALEKEAQRRADMERRRQQDDERKKAEQKKEMERQQQREKVRIAAQEDAKNLAQKQQIEKRRLEMTKKAEQIKNTMKNGGIQSGTSTTRGELGASRTAPKLSNMANVSQTLKKVLLTNKLRGAPNDGFNPSASQMSMNGARPVKRPIGQESEAPQIRLIGNNDGAGYQQMDSKRRRTNELDESQNRPIRPPPSNSAIRKDGPIRPTFVQGYAPVTQQGTHPQAMKHAGGSHHPQQVIRQGLPMDMSKYISTDKIPFADPRSNSQFPMPPMTRPQQSQMHRPPQGSLAPPAQSQRSSPYREGDEISLPDIPSDSDVDDSPAFSVKSWVLSPNLNDTLLRQHNVDPESIFGSIAPLHMEEIFKNKERHHRFRARTSSANWTGQDRLTAEEIRRDIRAREKLMREGGWTYGNYGS